MDKKVQKKALSHEDSAFFEFKVDGINLRATVPLKGLADGLAQGLGFIRPFPGKALVFPAEVAVDSGLAELRAPLMA